MGCTKRADLIRQRGLSVHAERGQQDGVAQDGRQRDRHRRVQLLRSQHSTMLLLTCLNI